MIPMRRVYIFSVFFQRGKAEYIILRIYILSLSKVKSIEPKICVVYMDVNDQIENPACQYISKGGQKANPASKPFTTL